jgi:hypothetical protein
MTLAQPDTQLYALGQRVPSGGGAALERAAARAVFLASVASGTLSGRLIRTVSDDFPRLPTPLQRLMASDALTLRRVDWPCDLPVRWFFPTSAVCCARALENALPTRRSGHSPEGMPKPRQSILYAGAEINRLYAKNMSSASNQTT